MTAPARIVVLDGPSSSGKTSAARALQPLLAAPHLHLQLDAFRAMEPAGYWADTGAAGARIELLCGAMHAALAHYARGGQPMIFDTVLDRRAAWRRLADDLAGLPVLLVGLRCEGAELARRERARGDRPDGLALAQAARHAAYDDAAAAHDLVVDTGRCTPAQAARRIADWLDTQPAPRAFLHAAHMA